MAFIYGYHRISTKEQHLDRGIIEIKRFCENQKIKLESIFTDKITGKNFDRPRYTVLVEDVLRVGDTLIITELDRLGRNKQEILKQLRFLEEKGVRVMVLELPTTLFDLSQMENNLAIVSWREIIKTILDFRCITILDVNLPVFINIEFMVSFRMELSDKVLQFFLAN